MAERISNINPILQEDYNHEKEIETQRTILDEEDRDPFIITFYINSQGNIFGFIAKGTTGFIQYGLDIIAAAVSALSINTVHSIKRFTEDDAEIETTKNYVKCLINGRVSKESILLFKSLRLGMDTIQNTYGEKYITIEEVKFEKSKRFFGLLG